MCNFESFLSFRSDTFVVAGPSERKMLRARSPMCTVGFGLQGYREGGLNSSCAGGSTGRMIGVLKRKTVSSECIAKESG